MKTWKSFTKNSKIYDNHQSSFSFMNLYLTSNKTILHSNPETRVLQSCHKGGSLITEHELYHDIGSPIYHFKQALQFKDQKVRHFSLFFSSMKVGGD